MTRNHVLAAAMLGVLAPACESEDGQEQSAQDAYLAPETVTSLPEGDAVGDGFSGDYQMRATVISCSGACGPFDVGDTRYVVCERDAESIEWVSVYQVDGQLRVDLDDDGHIGINVAGYVPVRLLGGIDADGGWDVGGFDTKFAESLESAARARGTVQEGEAPEGTLEVHALGEVGGTEIDCHMTHRLVAVDPGE